MADSAWNTERIVRLAALVILALACLQVILPFIGALTWAAIIAISIWPAFVWLSARLGNRPRLAAFLCSLALLAILVAPIAVLTATVGQTVPQVASLLRDLAVSISPVTPDWIRNLPVVGPTIHEVWTAAVTDMTSLVRKAMPAAEEAGVWAIAQGANLAVALLEFLFATLIAGVLLVTADRFADLAERVVSRLRIARGDNLIAIVVGTVRSVSIGLAGTAAIQALMAAIGFYIADMPAVVLLGFITFLLALIQMPTLLVWAPAAAWLYYEEQTGHATFLVIWGLVLVNSVDNIVRPYLISRGARLPFALILMGVIGGLLAWGLIGLFIGPTLLAVAFSLVRTWIGSKAQSATAGEEPLTSSAERPPTA